MARYYVGKIPEDVNFYPLESGWNNVKEPSPEVAQLIGIPIGVIVTGFMMFFTLKFTPINFTNINFIYLFIYSIPITFLIIPIHELIHAFFHPGKGLSDKTVIGFWPSQLLFYAHYEGMMSRNRFLFTLVSPFLFLSVFPLVFCAISSYESLLIGYIANLNSLFASVDIFGFFLIFFQIPQKAFIRNKGWKSYWKIHQIK